MTTHLGVMILFAACVSLLFGVLLRDGAREELRLAAKIFVGFVFGAYALGWLLYLGFN